MCPRKSIRNGPSGRARQAPDETQSKVTRAGRRQTEKDRLCYCSIKPIWHLIGSSERTYATAGLAASLYNAAPAIVATIDVMR